MDYLNVLIFTISIAILTIGLIRFYNLRSSRRHVVYLVHALLCVVGFAVIVNGADVFIDGNQTLLRQVVFLGKALIVAGFSLRR